MYNQHIIPFHNARIYHFVIVKKKWLQEILWFYASVYAVRKNNLNFKTIEFFIIF